MARARKKEAVALPLPSESGSGGAATRSLHTTRAATDLSLLLRARSFCLGGEGPAVQRVRTNLLLGESFTEGMTTAQRGAGVGAIDPQAAVWIGIGLPPTGQLSISLSEHAGTLGPYSFGFLNNVDGVAPLAAPIAQHERPRRGTVALVVPRRDALPEVVPLLLARDLGISWLISVGDGDPSEVLRFLSIDPATTGVLLAVGKGVRAPTLQTVLGQKPAVLLDLSAAGGAPGDGALYRAVARRVGAPVVTDLEEWLAHGSLMDAGTRLRSWVPVSSPSAPLSKRTKAVARARAALVVLGAGADLVKAEAVRAQLPAPLRVDSDDVEATAAALQKAALGAELVVLCGSSEVTAELQPAAPTLRLDPAQPERLRALLRALSLPTRQAGDEQPIQVVTDTQRVDAILQDLPPPLYVGEARVSDELLADHDCKRLLHAYGAVVSRQAPAHTVTAALRVLSKLEVPLLLLPPLPPVADVLVLAAAEAREVIHCCTVAEAKRQVGMLLGRHPYVVLREALPEAPRVRVSVVVERGLGPTLRITSLAPTLRADEPPSVTAGLLPLLQGEARELAVLLGQHYGCSPTGLSVLLGQLSACAMAHDLMLDVLILPADAPVVVSATGVLKRRVARS